MVQRPQSDPDPSTSPSGGDRHRSFCPGGQRAPVSERPLVSRPSRVVLALGGRHSHEVCLVGAPLRLASQTPFPQPSSVVPLLGHLVTPEKAARGSQ